MIVSRTSGPNLRGRPPLHFGSSAANPWALNAWITSRAYCAVAANIAPASVALRPDCVQARYAVAVGLLGRGDTAKGLDVCRQILVLWPDDELARRVLAEYAPRPPQPAPAPGPKAKPGPPR